jgi:hypothetical protein
MAHIHAHTNVFTAVERCILRDTKVGTTSTKHDTTHGQQQMKRLVGLHSRDQASRGWVPCHVNDMHTVLQTRCLPVCTHNDDAQVGGEHSHLTAIWMANKTTPSPLQSVKAMAAHDLPLSAEFTVTTPSAPTWLPHISWMWPCRCKAGRWAAQSRASSSEPCTGHQKEKKSHRRSHSSDGQGQSEVRAQVSGSIIHSANTALHSAHTALHSGNTALHSAHTALHSAHTALCIPNDFLGARQPRPVLPIEGLPYTSTQRRSRVLSQEGLTRANMP